MSEVLNFHNEGESPEGESTDDVRLAAALLSLGIEPMISSVGISVVRVDRGGECKEFFFKGRSKNGKFVTREMMKAWAEGERWIERNLEHPFSYIMAAMMNLRDLSLYLERGEQMAMVQRGKSVGLLPTHASARCEELVLGKLGG